MNSASNETRSYLPEGRLLDEEQEDSTTVFVPTAVQLQRANELKRFNRWRVYVPLGVLTTAVLGFVIYLLIIAIWPPYEDTRLFLSGIADIILILFLLPVFVFLGLVLLGIIGGVIYWRQSRKESGESSLQGKYGRLRLLLWKIDQKLSGVYRQADKLMPMAATPIIRFNAFMAYINSWLAYLTGQLNRHDAE